MGKPTNTIPDRWQPYTPMGSVVPGTCFIACKVPLREAMLRRLPKEEWFGPKDLMNAFPKLGLLIDLTNTTRYYSEKEFISKGINYKKIFCPGHVIPTDDIVKYFFDAVDRFLDQSKESDTLIAVHCTHGVNRTGYFICRYMIERLNILPEDALERVEKARGHKIERKNYVDDLKGRRIMKNMNKGGSESDLNSRFPPHRPKDSRILRRDSRTEDMDREPNKPMSGMKRLPSHKEGYNWSLGGLPFEESNCDWKRVPTEDRNTTYYSNDSQYDWRYHDPKLEMLGGFVTRPRHQPPSDRLRPLNPHLCQERPNYQQNHDRPMPLNCQAKRPKSQPAKHVQGSMESEHDYYRSERLESHDSSSRIQNSRLAHDRPVNSELYCDRHLPSARFQNRSNVYYGEQVDMACHDLPSGYRSSPLKTPLPTECHSSVNFQRPRPSVLPTPQSRYPRQPPSASSYPFCSSSTCSAVHSVRPPLMQPPY